METLYLKGTLHLKQSLRESLQQKMKKKQKKKFISLIVTKKNKSIAYITVTSVHRIVEAAPETPTSKDS
jgi:DNA repair protein RadC